ncbi:hypothetical protein [Okeania sp. SIO3B5]|nr:hypothetical protein [Okeania sp. SIO3B5]
MVFEGRRKKEEGRRKKEEGRRKNEKFNLLKCKLLYLLKSQVA